MILATIKGRLQTKLLTYVILAGITAVFIWFKGFNFLELFIIAVVIGIILETIWGVIISYQPGWAVFVFGVIEFTCIYILAFSLSVPITFAESLIYYLSAWSVIQLFLIYILPVWRLSWADDGSELW